MKFGCFAAVEPFGRIENQFKAIKSMGIDYADISDNHNGGSLGVEFGFNLSVSQDALPRRVKKMAADAAITLTTVCAHANLLDPEGPEFSTPVLWAEHLGVKRLIEPHGEVTDNIDAMEELLDKLGHKESRRGSMFGCGMAPIAVGEGVIDVKGVVKALKEIGYNGQNTISITFLRL